MIGFFVNTLVLRTDLSGSPNVREVIQRVRTITLEAYAHQDLPFEKVVEELHPERDLSRQPLFQVLFVFQNFPMPSLELADLSLSPIMIESGSSKFDLSLSLEDTTKGLTGWFEYNTDLFKASTIGGSTAIGSRMEPREGAPFVIISSGIAAGCRNAHRRSNSAAAGLVCFTLGCVLD